MSKLCAFLERIQRKAGIECTASETAPDASVYGSQSYWDARYEDGAIGNQNAGRGVLANEWYVGYAVLRSHILGSIPLGNVPVVLLGGGLSTMGEEMAEDGYGGVRSIDYSPVCVERMREEQDRRAAAGELTGGRRVVYEVMDCRALAYDDGSVAAVIDKAMLDTLFNSDDPPANTARSASRRLALLDAAFLPVPDSLPRSMLREACRVLSPGGVFLCLSYADDRRDCLRAADLAWDVADSPAVVAKGAARFHLYTAIKKSPS